MASSSPSPNMSNRRRRSSYTTEFKLKVVKYAEENGGNRAAGREYDLDESVVRGWRKNVAQLKKMPSKKRANRCGITKFPELEKDLLQYVHDRRNNGRAVTTIMIRRQAKQIAKDRGLKDFIGGPSWCHRFMKRAGLSVRSRTTVGQRTPDNWEELMASFQDFTARNIDRLRLNHDKIINMDEVPMTFDAPMTRTVTNTGDKTVTITTTGHEKTHFTVVLACTASGKKLKPMVIFKRITKPKEKLPSGISVLCNQKGKFQFHYFTGSFQSHSFH